MKKLKNRPLLSGGLVYLAFGYALYFAGLNLNPAPEWARDLIEAMKPLVKALITAERVADRLQSNPFSAQAVILYCAIASVLLTAWFTYSIVGKKEVRNRWLSIYASQGLSRLRLATYAVVLLLSLLLFPTILFVHNPQSISWQAISFFSSSAASVSFLLLMNFVPAIAVPSAMCFLRLALFGHKLNSPPKE